MDVNSSLKIKYFVCILLYKNIIVIRSWGMFTSYYKRERFLFIVFRTELLNSNYLSKYLCNLRYFMKKSWIMNEITVLFKNEYF